VADVAGANSFDAWLGGIGGCSYALGAKAGRRFDLHAVPSDLEAIRDRALARVS